MALITLFFLSWNNLLDTRVVIYNMSRFRRSSRVVRIGTFILIVCTVLLHTFLCGSICIFKTSAPTPMAVEMGLSASCCEHSLPCTYACDSCPHSQVLIRSVTAPTPTNNLIAAVMPASPLFRLASYPPRDADVLPKYIPPFYRSFDPSTIVLRC